MIKILHITRNVWPTGATRSMVATAKYSSRLGDFHHRVISLLPADGIGLGLAREAEVTAMSAPNRNALLREIEQADVVHVHWWNNPEMTEFLRSELPAMRLIIWFHVAGDQAPHVITKELVDFADFALASCPYTYEHPVFQNLPPEVRAKKTGMVYATIDFKRFAGIKRQPHAAFNVGYVGTVDFVKMHPRYVAMSAAIDIPNVRFIVCGHTSIKDLLLRQAQQLGAAKRFEFRGFVSDLRSVYEILDVFGYPLCEATYAGAELVLHEAMYAGIPPVVFPYGGVKRLVMNDDNGLVVQNEREYKQAIEYLYHHPQERERLGRNASEYARRILGAERAAKQLNSIYEKMMHHPKRQRLWGNRSGFCQLERSISSDEVLKKSEKASGAHIFLESLGGAKPCFLRSMTAQDLRELLAAEREIALSSLVLRSTTAGGILHYRKYYPHDGFLRLWSGLVLHQDRQYAEAALEYVAAIKRGCKHWRIAWYLAQLAEQAKDLDSAQQALQIVLQAVPDFAEAQEMAQRLARLTCGVSGGMASLTNADGATKMPFRTFLASRILPGLVAQASGLLLNAKMPTSKAAIFRSSFAIKLLVLLQKFKEEELQGLNPIWRAAVCLTPVWLRVKLNYVLPPPVFRWYMSRRLSP